MPQPVNNIKGEQWDTCDQCGSIYPMSRLVKQKGALICTTKHCFDNLLVERRPFMIESVLGSGGGDSWEGADTRIIDRGFFEGFDETNR